MAYLTRTDNLAAIARLGIQKKHGDDLTALRRADALDLIKRAVADAAVTIGGVYSHEESDAVQALMLRLVRNDQH